MKPAPERLNRRPERQTVTTFFSRQFVINRLPVAKIVHHYSRIYAKSSEVMPSFGILHQLLPLRRRQHFNQITDSC